MYTIPVVDLSPKSGIFAVERFDKSNESYDSFNMTKKYTAPPIPSPRVSDMPVVTATQLKTATSDVFDLVAKNKAVAIHRHDKARGVLLSVEQYEALTGGGGDWLADLTAECEAMVDAMQSPEQKEAAMLAFNATPEELGEAAVWAARRAMESGEIKR